MNAPPAQGPQARCAAILLVGLLGVLSAISHQAAAELPPEPIVGGTVSLGHRAAAPAVATTGTAATATTDTRRIAAGTAAENAFSVMLVDSAARAVGGVTVALFAVEVDSAVLAAAVDARWGRADPSGLPGLGDLRPIWVGVSDARGRVDSSVVAATAHAVVDAMGAFPTLLVRCDCGTTQSVSRPRSIRGSVHGGGVTWQRVVLIGPRTHVEAPVTDAWFLCPPTADASLRLIAVGATREALVLLGAPVGDDSEVICLDPAALASASRSPRAERSGWLGVPSRASTGGMHLLAEQQVGQVLWSCGVDVVPVDTRMESDLARVPRVAITSPSGRARRPDSSARAGGRAAPADSAAAPALRR
ncbi:MAG: hypothetical protein IPK26_13320 [Planctomycetes bacterium]|nr:hypothetical protein [Planctomycetota bacterium]